MPARFPLAKLLLSALLTVALPAVPAAAADPAFVGILALVVEDDVAQQLELSDETSAKLRDLVAEREDDAIEFALSIKDLPVAEKQQRMATFVAESERLGFELLTEQQQARLRQVRIARDGAGTLAELEVAAQLKLSDEQQTKIGALLQQRGEELTKGGEEDRRITLAKYERQLMALLDQEQRAAWERLAGLAADEADQVAQADAGEPEDTDPSMAPPAAAAEGDTVAGAAGEDPASDAVKPPTTDIAEAEGGTGPESQPDQALSPDEVKAAKDAKLKFSFRFAPWEAVLEWFAEQADLSLVLDAPPPGTFNYSDTRTYTPAEAIDLLNSVLLTKGYTLVRHRRMLMLINLEDGIPPNLVTHVPIEDLDEVGEFELVTCLFQLEKMTPAEAEAEINELLGPQGSMVALPKAQQVLITETGGRLRTIQRVIERIERPVEEEDIQEVVTFPIEHVAAEEVLVVARQLLGLPEEQNAAADGSIRIAVDPLGSKFFVTGDAKTVERFGEILKLVDVAADFDFGDGGLADPPQLEVYTITDADPASVLAVMQTLLAGLPDVRLTSDPKTGNLVALARPSQHATIRATLDQMQQDGLQIEVIRLRVVDPQLAVLSINKLFGVGEEGDGGRNAPTVDADPTTRQLLIRGTTNQVEQIRSLLEKMGETESDIAATDDGRGGNVRMLPITGSVAQSVLEQVEQVWPTMRRNQIRVVTPTRSIRSLRPGGELERQLGVPEGLLDGGLDMLLPPRPRRDADGTPAPRRDPAGNSPPATPSTKAAPATPSSAKPGDAATPPAEPAEDRSAWLPLNSEARFFFTAAPVPDDVDGTAEPAAKAAPDDNLPTTPPNAEPSAAPLNSDAEGVSPRPEESVPPTGPATIADPNAPEAQGPDGTADIIVSVGPTGIMIASEDLDALDDFEALITTLADRMAASGERFTVFYLKYARADIAAQLLEEILGGGSGDDGGGGGSLFGDIAGQMLGGGGGGGGLMGTLLGLGGGGGGDMDLSLSTTGAVTIVPDLRLNALVVEANPTDRELIEQLLEVIDQEASPEKVQTVHPPQLIPVYYTSAQEVAAVVREVFAPNLAAGRGGQRQPSPEEFIRALRGGSRGGRDSSSSRSQEQQTMTVGIDERSNSLVVSAPEALLRQVEQLVEQLDQAGVESEQMMRVVSIRRADPAVVHQAIRSLVGQSRSSTTSRTSTGSSASRPSTSTSRPSASSAMDQMRQRMMMLNSARGSSGGGNTRAPTQPSRAPTSRPSFRGR